MRDCRYKYFLSNTNSGRNVIFLIPDRVSVHSDMERRYVTEAAKYMKIGTVGGPGMFRAPPVVKIIQDLEK